MHPTGVAPIDRALGGLTPGLPVVLAGPSGSGRTVLCLELAAAALARGERVGYLTREPPALLLTQAASLGLSLEPGLHDGRFALLELDGSAPATLQLHGAQTLVEALLAEAPDTQLWIVDPITSLSSEMLDEGSVRALVQTLFAALGGPGSVPVVTADRERRVSDDPIIERALRDLCGSYLELDLDEEGDSQIRVAKSRSAGRRQGEIAFRIGAGGSQLVEPERSEAPASAPRKILVVDDDEEILIQVTRWLSDRWTVVSARDGVEALSRVMAERPDAVLLDLNLPRLSGREVLHMLREGRVPVPILVFSGQVSRSSDRVGALVLGATDVVSKPIHRLELVHRVEALLERPRRPASAPGSWARALLHPEAEPSPRRVTRAQLLERLETACRVGEECGIGSSMLFVELPREQAFEEWVAAADEVLRVEDALLPISSTRAVALLVGTEMEKVADAVERLGERLRLRSGAEEAPFDWAAAPAREVDAASADAEWKSHFQDMQTWPARESG